MQKVLSRDLWRTIRTYAGKADQRKAAVAYVTQDLIGFSKGDVLVVDASERAIACGETNAPLLRSLQRRGVQLYDCGDLHAKVLLLDEVAVISSGNMSNSSNNLVEVGLLTDHSSTVAGISSFFEQLIPQSKKLSATRISALCKIEVVRRGARTGASRKKHKTRIVPIGNRTWLIGVYELVRDPPPDEQTLIDRAVNSLQSRLNHPKEEFDWVRWSSRGRFPRECREGDSVIQIWGPYKAKRPITVSRVAPVLLKQRTKRWTRFYLGAPIGRNTQLSWGSFKRLLKEIGYSRHVGPGIVQLLEPDTADAIERKWNAAAKW